MTRAEKIDAITYWEAVARKATQTAKALRSELEIEAREEYAREGVAPSWKSSTAAVTLPITAPDYRITDEAALIQWVAARHPEQIQTRTEIHPSYLRHLTADLLTRGDEPVSPDGEPVPGVAYYPGGEPRSIQIRPKPGVRDIMDDLAEAAMPQLATRTTT